MTSYNKMIEILPYLGYKYKGDLFDTLERYDEAIKWLILQK